LLKTAAGASFNLIDARLTPPVYSKSMRREQLYLLRLWSDGTTLEGEVVWRVGLEDLSSGAGNPVTHFESVKLLENFLETHYPTPQQGTDASNL